MTLEYQKLVLLWALLFRRFPEKGRMSGNSGEAVVQASNHESPKAQHDVIHHFSDIYAPFSASETREVIHVRTVWKDSERYDLRLKQAFGNLRFDQIKRHEIPCGNYWDKWALIGWCPLW